MSGICRAPPLDVVWLSPDWYCVLHQPVASHSC